ncbi:DNA-binding protein WhiA, partial [Enterococcus faecalis]|uniref:DNA-binding protein WhiA n=1 Tax=Enterococcus faecalis TaxID=1351 RepID=UPI003984A402
QRMARDLHDTLAQGLVSLNMQLDAIHVHLAKGNTERAKEIIQQSMKRVKIERKKGYITYLKEAEKITEFLNVIGAHNSLLRFEDVRIV